MNIKIRNKTFETNSSSVHSLVINKDGREISQFKLNKDGKIEVPLMYFGKEYRIYDTQIEKLSYLLTCCKYLTRGWDEEELYEDWNFREIEEAIMEYCPGCTGIQIINFDDGELDHQSIPYGDIEIIGPMYDHEQIIDFVFNKNIALKTDCD